MRTPSEEAFITGWYWDLPEAQDYSSDTNDEEYEPITVPRHRRRWVNENYDVLMELYKTFRSNGEAVFGRCFYQLGDFSKFIDLIYENTCLPNADLLKANVSCKNVHAVGSGSRR